MNAATFFVPQGRLSRGQFQTAALVLIVINFVLALGSLVPGATAAMAVGSLTTLLGLVVAYMWVVLWIKRLHNANVTGWMTILVVIGWMILSYVISTVVQTMVAPDMSDAIADAMATDGFGGMMEVTASYGRQLALPSAISGAIVSAIYALGLNMILKNSTEENQYGPSPVGNATEVSE